jgi:hypothetical protein
VRKTPTLKEMSRQLCLLPFLRWPFSAACWERDEKALVPERNGSLLRARGFIIALLARRPPARAREDSIRAIMTKHPGEVPERLNGAVSKTVVALRATVGSNPTLSAMPAPDGAGFVLGPLATQERPAEGAERASRTGRPCTRSRAGWPSADHGCTKVRRHEPRKRSPSDPTQSSAVRPVIGSFEWASWSV